MDFSNIELPTLVVCGSEDDPQFTPRGPEWHADVFNDAPGANALLTINGVGHGLGGIAGLDARETETEDPEALEATRRLTLAWLRNSLSIDADAWTQSQAALQSSAAALAKITIKTEMRKEPAWFTRYPSRTHLRGEGLLHHKGSLSLRRAPLIDTWTPSVRF